MDKSDLDIYQNIVLTAGDNDTNDVTLSRATSNNQSAGGGASGGVSGGGGSVGAGMNCLQTCQICGVVLKIDASLVNMNEATYRQLSLPFAYRDELYVTMKKFFFFFNYFIISYAAA